MELRTVVLPALLLGALWSGYQKWTLREVHPREGSVAPLDPQQADFPSPVTIQHGRWSLTQRAHYEITARLLHREHYAFDALADLAPEDLALGWGALSDNKVLATLDITQSARFLSWYPHADLALTREQITLHSANTHVIPADALVAKQLARLRVGQVVRLTGTLVDGVRDDGVWFRTSLTRADTGAGACEVMLVERIEIE
jgi:hypothetical protein